MAPARLVERILQEHVGRGDLVDNGKITGLAPKFIEPTANNGLVCIFVRHRFSFRANGH
jgi:hypothetical protein